MNKAKIPVLILAGGLGTRISEETHLKPKPMIEIGEIPLLVHIMRHYYAFGFRDFVVCAGYRSWDIKEFFLNYCFRSNHLEIDHRESLNQPPKALGANTLQEDWRIRVLDTGAETMTGGRVARALDVISNEPFSEFALTYGDGLCDVDLNAELAFHHSHGAIATLLGVPPLSRFGELETNREGKVLGFTEKPEQKTGLINGGFFILKREFREYLSPVQSCVLERAPLERAALEGQLRVYEHRGFWQCMDTLRDKNKLQDLWDQGNPPWVVKP